MKRWLLAAVLLVFAAQAKAQSSVAPASPPSMVLLPIGSPFGANGAWQFGLNVGGVPGACLQRDVAYGQWLVGPCYELLDLAKKNSTGALDSVFNVGGHALYNAQGAGASYGLHAGANVLATSGAVLQEVAQLFPYLESIADWQAPPWTRYVTNIVTVDYGFDLPIGRKWGHGPTLELNIPLPSLRQIQQNGL